MVQNRSPHNRIKEFSLKTKNPHIQEFPHTANEMAHMFADDYQQGIDEGTIHRDLNPVSAAILSRMSL